MPRALFLALPLLLVPACSSSDDPGSTPQPACTVNCPAGTFCDGDRCVPLCSPPCGPGQYCGADRTCHDGPAPDGNVVTPLDGGPPKQDGPRPTADQGTKPDTVDPNKQLCDCLAQQPQPAYCIKQAVTCQTAADCCQPTSPVPCGTYGNKYACTAGKCVAQGCASKSECVSYAQALQQADAADWTCFPPTCAGKTSYCSYQVKSCTKASDCCRPGQVPCGLYSNHWSCDAGKCKYTGCLGDAECVTYAQALSLPNAATYACRTTSCYNTGYCVPVTQTCSQPSDCCNPQSPLPCGVYTNRFRCEKGACVMDYCTGKQDCLTYATTLNLPDASAYNCVAY